MSDVGDSLLSQLVVLRRWFHQHPELAFEEAETAQKIIAELDELEIPCEYVGIGHSVIGRIPCSHPENMAIGLRAEIDPLPGIEPTGMPYASLYPGKMLHAATVRMLASMSACAPVMR